MKYLFLLIISLNFTLYADECPSGTGMVTNCKAYIDNVSIVEGDSDSQTMTFTIKLKDDKTVKSGADVKVRYVSSEDTATNGEDYDDVDETITFDAGDNEKTFTVTIYGDSTVEDDETFKIELESKGDDVDIDDDDDPDAVGTIENNDDAIYVEEKSVREGNDYTIYFKSDRAVTKDIDFDYQLEDDTADSDDYEAQSGSVHFDAGDTEQSITITTKSDDIAEDPEDFVVNITTDDGDNTTFTDGKITIKEIDCSKSGTIDLAMKDNYGDAEQQGDDVDHSSSDLEMMYDGDNEQKIGMVFEGVDIEQGCYVKNAYIQFTAKVDQSGDTSVVIYGEDVDNAENYKEDRKVTDATKTEEVVKWTNIKAWADGQSDEDTRTPQLSCLAEKILKRDNWDVNNSMGFILNPTEDCDSDECNRRGYSGSDDDYKAVLHIEYSDNREDSTPCQIAVDDNFDVRMGEETRLVVTENDADGIDDESIRIKTEPSHGSYEIDGNDVIYTPESGYKGDDNLTYTVVLDGEESNEALVSLNVTLVKGDVEFHIINPGDTRNIKGDFFIGGNMSLCVADDEDAECESQAGTNDTYLKYIDIDDDDETYNSSAFTLDIPDESEVIWAGLFWGGFIHNSDNDGSQCDDDGNSDDNDWRFDDKISGVDLAGSGCGIDLSDDPYDTDKVKFKHPKTDEYIDVDATTVYFSGYGYSGYANITNIFDDNDDLRTDPNGEYILANLSTNHTKMKEHGNSGGWSMVVIYKNENLEYKNVTVYHGWKEVDENHPVDINVSGFLVPDTEDEVKAKLSFISHDGDGGTCYFKLNDEKLGLWTDEAGNDHDDRDEVFNSTIIGVPQKRPDFDLTDDTDDEYSSFEIDTYDANGILEAGDTSANIKMEMSNSAAFEVPLIIFSADMFAPKLCYDYSYKQGDLFFTEENNGTVPPRIVGDIDETKDIDVEIYFRNEEADLEAVKVIVDVEDINTSQSTYTRESSWITQPSSTQRDSIADDDLNVSDSYDKNFSVNDIGSHDYLYLGYSLEPKGDSIDDDLNIYIQYSIVIDDDEILLPKMKLGSKEINICADDSVYKPTLGSFNVVHRDYYKDGDTYLNIPTQVVDRKGRFKVLSLDENGSDLESRTTIVAVEYIDAEMFHDTEASCHEMNSSVSAKDWIIFDDEDTKDFDKSLSVARKNTSYRVSFHNDVNGSIISLEKSGDNYKINDYDAVFEDIDKCDACGEDGDELSVSDLTTCMNCIYGQRTGFICSRDNFATRPEAFYMKLQDQKQDDTTQKSNITNNIDVTADINLTAGYKYLVDLNATSYTKEKENVDGYIISNNLVMQWNGSGSECNDENNVTTVARFYDGKAESNISISNVGEYRLEVVDDSWSLVDRKPMVHHDGNFTDDENDCIVGDDVVATEDESEDADPLNGCMIRSKHHNQYLDVEYKAIDIDSSPYGFSIDFTESIGLNDDAIDADSFVYMADMIENSYENENMSYHIDSTITAVGYDNKRVSNFVDGCYAQEIDLGFISSDRALFKYTFLNENADKHINGDLGNDDNITLGTDNFVKDFNGTMVSRINLNYDRRVDTALNPTKVDFNQTIITIKNATYANLVDNYSTKVIDDINNSIKYLYGRAHVSRNKYSEDTSSDRDDNKTAYIYYEVYCQGSGCDKTLLPNGNNSKYSDDPRWFINTEHNLSFGTAGEVNQRGYSVDDGYIKQKKESYGEDSDSEQDKFKITYDGTRRYPYIATMEHNASAWLIYSKYNASATKNDFLVEFTKKKNDWAGKTESGMETTTETNASTRILRRIHW